MARAFDRGVRCRAAVLSGLGALGTLILVNGCGGPEFKTASGTGGTPSSGGELGAASGGAASGGATGGGATGEGGSTEVSGGSAALGGTMNDGGRASGGEALGGLAGIGGLFGGGTRSFPNARLLDDFNRRNGSLGSDWAGPTDRYEIKDRTLRDVASGGLPLFWATKFDVAQEAFAKLADFSSDQKEINLVLWGQDPDAACDFIEVLYKPLSEELGLDYCANGEWHTVGTYSLRLDKGDELGARITPDARVFVFVNRKLATTFDAASYPYRGGYIGVDAYDGGLAAWDDFGGGDLR